MKTEIQTFLQTTTAAVLLAAALGACQSVQPPEDRKAAKSLDEQPFTEYRYGDYRFRIHRDEFLSPGFAEPLVADETLVVLKGGKRLFTATDHRIDVKPFVLRGGHPPSPTPFIPLGTDITGDGRPNMLVGTYSGGAHCCLGYLIFEIGERFRLVDHLQTDDSSIYLRQIDGVPGLEIELGDDTFAYWKTSFSGSPMPRVILKYSGGKYRAAPALMKEPPLSPRELEDLVRQVRESPLWKRQPKPLGGDLKSALANLESDRGREGHEPKLWAVMLDLVYTGNLSQARLFLELAWPPGRAGKQDFAKEFFACQLRRSEYWPAIAKLNGVPAANPPPDCPPGPESG